METAALRRGRRSLRRHLLAYRRPRAGGVGRRVSARLSRPSAAIVFVATVPASAWLSAQCDAYSIPQFAIAAIAGAGLAAAASLEPLRRHFATRLLALAGVGAAAAATVLLLFPQCLAAPYAMLDPRLKTFFARAPSTEAQPIWSIVRNNPAMAVELLRDAGSGRSSCSSGRYGAAGRRTRQSSSWRFLSRRLPSASGRCAARCSRYRWPPSRWPPGSASGGRGSEQAARQRH